MKRMTTKMSTVTPVTKSTGSGVANMGKKSKGLSMAQNKTKSPSRLSSAEAAKEMSGTKSNMPQIGMSTTVKRKNVGMPSIGMERTSEPMFAIGRKVVKTGTKVPKAKAKMLPEVKVTAPKTKGRLALKVTSRRMK